MEGFAVSWTRNATRISTEPLFMTLKKALALSQPSQDTLQITHFLVNNDRKGTHLAQKWNSSCHSILLALQLEQTWLLRRYLQTRGSEESVARLVQKAPWLTHSIIYPMKIHALHKRHILTLSRLTSRFFLPPVSFRHLLRITLSNTSQLLLESYGGTVVSFSWQSVQLCQHIHCAYHVPVVCKTPPIPSNDRCHQSRK